MNRQLSMLALAARMFLGWWLVAIILGSWLGGLVGFGVGLLLMSWVALGVACWGTALQARGFREFPSVLDLSMARQAAIQVAWSVDESSKILAGLLQEDLAATSISVGNRRIQALFRPSPWSGWFRKWAGSDEIQVQIFPFLENAPEGGGCRLEVQARALSRLFNGVLWVDRGRNFRRMQAFQAALAASLEAERRRQASVRKSETLETRLAQAELLLLRAQFEPHCLFNTLAHLRVLITNGEPGKALEMLDHLTAYTRALVNGTREALHGLDQELETTRAYLSLLQLRFGDRLRFEIQVNPEALGYLVPVGALLIPAENAIKHGLEPRGEGGCVELHGQVEQGRLHLEVLDDGRGLQPAQGPGHGTGLANLRERLQLSFPGEARLLVEDRDTGGVRFDLNLPLCPSQA